MKNNEYFITYTVYGGIPKEFKGAGSSGGTTREYKAKIVISAPTAIKAIEGLVEENSYQIKIDDIHKI